MPSALAVSRGKRRQVVKSESDGDDATPYSQASSNKRRRLSRDSVDEANGSTREVSEGSGSDSESSTAETTRSADSNSAPPTDRSQVETELSGEQDDGQQTPDTDSNGSFNFRPGAIVRIKLTNFVTYTAAECFPGPRLNMVIGPNGTGKSTIVCAICLGLGWGPQYLGRAKDPAEFVKHGSDEAVIEIELQARPNMRQNPIIRRIIKREGNKSTFTINGKASNKIAVLELSKSFSIQIDNLCQFLPQDKVSEFAALSPIELLHSTQRAAAGPEMVKWHESLKALRADQKEVLAKNLNNKELLTNLESRQAMQREDVERLRQREETKKRLQLLEMAKPIVHYANANNEKKELKAKRIALIGERERFKSRMGPALKSVSDKQEYFSKIQVAVKERKDLFGGASKNADRLKDKINEFNDKIKNLRLQVDAERKTGMKYAEERKKLHQGINKLQREIDKGPVEFDAAAFTEKIRDLTRQIREVENEARELQTQKQTTFRNVQSKQAEISRAEKRLASLESRAGQQEEKLRKTSNDAFTAWQWIKENQNLFDKKVYGPPMVECSVNDPRYASAIEALLHRNDLLAFTTQTRADFRTLQQKLNQEMRLHDISIKTCTVSVSSLNSPVTDHELRNLNFDGWAKDYISGPEPVLAMLCSENRFHQTAVTLRDISDAEYRSIENSNITTWVAGNKYYSVIRRREYGSGATSTRVRALRPAHVWTNQPVDATAKQELQSNIAEWKQQFQEASTQEQEERSRLERLKTKFASLNNEKAELEKEKQEKQTAQTLYRGLDTKISQLKERLKTADERADGMKERVEAFRDQQDEAVLERATAIIQYATSTTRLLKFYDQLTHAEVLSIEAISDIAALKQQNAENTRLLEQKDKEIEAVTAQVAEMNRKIAPLLAQTRALHSRLNATPGLKEMIDTARGYTIEQLEANIDSEKARLELTQGGGSHIIQEFEDRQKGIDDLSQKLEESQARLNDLQASIAEIRGRWEPRLDDIVSKISEAFSDNFARIGCAGQVSVSKADASPDADIATRISDFDQWSIRIQVKFREHEGLSVLDSHRQSGGERAVSTIFYLMALQSLSASPFRVVDEINQGMDPRNERMVHERMVDIACGQADSETSGGQYFLITPKLLSGLAYKPGMTVLCIFSGDFVPENYKVNFSKCVGFMRDVLAERAQARQNRTGRALSASPSNSVDVSA
ncbi:Structural maintenance of chromosomes protein 5 [Myotisia sp. PD_48]|nr:Structural maintenance of chromosomes protein 5 [Myotisia sp. PD_48]